MTTTREGAKVYCIRLPNGRWWRRGAGSRPGGATRSVKWATQYRNKGAAKRAAGVLCLEEEFGGYEIVECLLVVGDVAMRVGS